jgi:cell division GTPase FtsZ
MKPMIVGIGGAGGNILTHFLQSQDVSLPFASFGDHVAFGNAKGVWLDSATQDAQEQGFYGDLEKSEYPGYLICHKIISDNSDIKREIMNKYGLDLKAQGYDRRAEYLKSIFEVFDLDEVKTIAKNEFKGEENPLPAYMWKQGIRPLTVISLGLGASTLNGLEPENKGRDEEGKEGGSILGGVLNSIKSIKMTSRNSNNDTSKNESRSRELCDSILFIASLGGGTGTGFINPITAYVRRSQKAFPIFALGILTEKGMDARKTAEGQKNLGATIAMYDLLTKPAGDGIDSLIVVDNEILLKKHNGDFKSIDRTIYSSLRPLLDIRNYPRAKLQDDAPAMKRVFLDADQNDILTAEDGSSFLPTPILVPCYHSHSGSRGGERSLVEHALQEGSRLFPCVPDRADRAFVFTRGFIREDKIKDAINEFTHGEIPKIQIYRKLATGGSEDILILLRNPYGGTAGEHRKEGTLEARIYNIVDSALDYIQKEETNIIDAKGYTTLTKDNLRNYFYGPGGMRQELIKVKERIAEGRKPIFFNLHPPKIFSKIGSEESDDEKRWIASADMSGEDEKASAVSREVEMLVKKEIQRLMKSSEFDERFREIIKET